MMYCTSCGKQMPDDAKFCPSCGQGLGAEACSCGAEVPAGAKFCPGCGKPVE